MKFKNKITILSLIIIMILSIIPSYGLSSNDAAYLKHNLNTSHIAIDNKNLEIIPMHFRKTTDIKNIKECYINTDGLKELNISGSQQFTPCNFVLIKNNINTKLPFVVVDLRQESHGFADCFPISLKNEKNDANLGLSRNLVLIKEQCQLSQIDIGKPLIFPDNDTSIIPRLVQNENNLCSNNDSQYIRITATDEVLPSSDNIDFFIKSIKERPQSCWYHFHCKEGVGRTTTFMIFYDMMRNYNNVSSKDIILREIALVSDFSEDDLKDITSARRLELYNLFYGYCKKYGTDFKVPFEKYLKEINLAIKNGNLVETK